MIGLNPAALGSSSATGSNSRNELGQKDFLRLMVAQLKNQDPVNPVENNEFLGQIAQFSMVSGIEGLGESFGGMQSNLFANQAMEAAQLVGKEVLVNTPEVSLLSGQTVAGVIDTPSSLNNLKVNVLSAAGDLLREINMGSLKPGIHEIAWDGQLENGNAAPEGDYVLQAVALVEGESRSVPIQLFQAVRSTSIDHVNGQISLNLANAESVEFSQVRKIK